MAQQHTNQQHTNRDARSLIQTRLASIHRYPVKGFGAQLLLAADLVPGQGIPFDRCFAITNGERTVPPDAAWVPCQAFVRLTRNTDLPGYALHFDEAGVTATLTGPDGRAARLSRNSSANEDAAQSLPDAWSARSTLGRSRTAMRTSTGEAGYWDHEDAAISIINLATVALLERAAGQPLDPLRFRANLYLEGLAPLDEVGLLGRRVRIGGAVLEVLRPIDRCRATSVDPSAGDTGLNVPALLGRTLGHVYCGVYARVVQAGRVAPGDEVEDVGPAPDAVRAGAAPVTAPPVQDWPRAARVVERVAESTSVVSFWLDDPLAPLRPPPRAGQHLRVHLVGDGGQAAWRCYTISSDEGSRLRISVKRDTTGRGTVSRRLHEAVAVGTPILMSGPYGAVHLQESDATPIILLSAGIGITPTVALLRELAASPAGQGRPVSVIHAARDQTDLALWAEVLQFVQRLPNATARLYFSRAGATECTAHGAVAGRIPLDAVLQGTSAGRDAEAFVCGPSSFLADARAALLQAGMEPGRVHIEAFASPKPADMLPGGAGARLPPAAGPFQVRFTAGGMEAVWRPEVGTLLDLAEATGLSPPANCRSGACGACRTLLLAGSVHHSPEPLLPAGTDAFLCCAVPLSDVVLA